MMIDKNRAIDYWFSIINKSKIGELQSFQNSGCVYKQTDWNFNGIKHENVNALILASYIGNRRVVSWLLTNLNFDVNSATNLGWTALCFAASQGHAKCASLLIQQGANVNVQTSQKNSPLDLALIKAKRDTVQVLIEAGAYMNHIEQPEELVKNGLVNDVANKQALKFKTSESNRFTIIARHHLTQYDSILSKKKVDILWKLPSNSKDSYYERISKRIANIVQENEIRVDLASEFLSSLQERLTFNDSSSDINLPIDNETGRLLRILFEYCICESHCTTELAFILSKICTILWFSPSERQNLQSVPFVVHYFGYVSYILNMVLNSSSEEFIHGMLSHALQLFQYFDYDWPHARKEFYFQSLYYPLVELFNLFQKVLEALKAPSHIKILTEILGSVSMLVHEFSYEKLEKTFLTHLPEYIDILVGWCVTPVSLSKCVSLETIYETFSDHFSFWWLYPQIEVKSLISNLTTDFIRCLLDATNIDKEQRRLAMTRHLNRAKEKELRKNLSDPCESFINCRLYATVLSAILSGVEKSFQLGGKKDFEWNPNSEISELATALPLLLNLSKPISGLDRASVPPYPRVPFTQVNHLMLQICFILAKIFQLFNYIQLESQILKQIVPILNEILTQADIKTCSELKSVFTLILTLTQDTSTESDLLLDSFINLFDIKFKSVPFTDQKEFADAYKFFKNILSKETPYIHKKFLLKAWDFIQRGLPNEVYALFILNLISEVSDLDRLQASELVIDTLKSNLWCRTTSRVRFGLLSMIEESKVSMNTLCKILELLLCKDFDTNELVHLLKVINKNFSGEFDSKLLSILVDNWESLLHHPAHERMCNLSLEISILISRVLNEQNKSAGYFKLDHQVILSIYRCCHSLLNTNNEKLFHCVIDLFSKLRGTIEIPKIENNLLPNRIMLAWCSFNKLNKSTSLIGLDASNCPEQFSSGAFPGPWLVQDFMNILITGKSISCTVSDWFERTAELIAPIPLSMYPYYCKLDIVLSFVCACIVENKLKSLPWNNSLRTLQAIEGALRGMLHSPPSNMAPELAENNPIFALHLKSQQCFSKLTSNQQIEHVFLLFRFVYILEKAIKNAVDGFVLALPPPSTSALSFYETNKSTCFEWQNRIRRLVTTLALNMPILLNFSYDLPCEMSSLIISQTTELLNDALSYSSPAESLKTLRKYFDVEEFFILMCKSYYHLGASSEIRSLQHLLKQLFQIEENCTDRELIWMSILVEICDGNMDIVLEMLDQFDAQTIKPNYPKFHQFCCSIKFHFELLYSNEIDEKLLKVANSQFQSKRLDCIKNLSNWSLLEQSTTCECQNSSNEMPQDNLALNWQAQRIVSYLESLTHQSLKDQKCLDRIHSEFECKNLILSKLDTCSSVVDRSALLEIPKIPFLILDQEPLSNFVDRAKLDESHDMVWLKILGHSTSYIKVLGDVIESKIDIQKNPNFTKRLLFDVQLFKKDDDLIGRFDSIIENTKNGNRLDSIDLLRLGAVTSHLLWSISEDFETKSSALNLLTHSLIKSIQDETGSLLMRQKRSRLLSSKLQLLFDLLQTEVSPGESWIESFHKKTSIAKCELSSRLLFICSLEHVPWVSRVPLAPPFSFERNNDISKWSNINPNSLLSNLLVVATKVSSHSADAWLRMANLCYSHGLNSLLPNSQSSFPETCQKHLELYSDALNKVLPEKCTMNDVYQTVLSLANDWLNASGDVYCLDDLNNLSALKYCSSCILKRLIPENAKDESFESLYDMIASYHIGLIQKHIAPCLDLILNRHAKLLLTKSAEAYKTYLTCGFASVDPSKGTCSDIDYGNIPINRKTSCLKMLRLITIPCRSIRQSISLIINSKASLDLTSCSSWFDCLPDCLVRLNHSDPLVCKTITDLICDHLLPSIQLRLTHGTGKDALGHLSQIILPAIVNLRTMRPGTLDAPIKGLFVSMSSSYLANIKIYFERILKRIELIGISDENDVDTTPCKTGSGYKNVNRLKSVYSNFAETVICSEKFVDELVRIALLWEELWIGVLSHYSSMLHKKCEMVFKYNQDLLRNIKSMNGVAATELYEIKPGSNKENQLLNSTTHSFKQFNNLNEMDNSFLTEKETIDLNKLFRDLIFNPTISLFTMLREATIERTPVTIHETWFKKSATPLINTCLAEFRKLDPLKHPNNKPVELIRDLVRAFQDLPGAPGKNLNVELDCNSQRIDAEQNMDVKVVQDHIAINKTRSALLNLRNISTEVLWAKKAHGILLPGMNGKLVNEVGIAVSVLNTKTRPKMLSIRAEDGRVYPYLLKGLEDLRLDQRIMHLLHLFNLSVAYNQPTLMARTYEVTPLSTHIGLIQMVQGATPLFILYKRHLNKKLERLRIISQQPPTKEPFSKESLADKERTILKMLRPSELFYDRFKQLAPNFEANKNPRNNWPGDVLEQVFTSLQNETPANILSRELWGCSPSNAQWWSVTRRYVNSLASTSAFSFIFGLGDRHLDNLMVDLVNGEMVHIDFSICFDRGTFMRVPEKVPFRLTKILCHTLGPSASYGNLESSISAICSGHFGTGLHRSLLFLRSLSQPIKMQLESFYYEPINDLLGIQYHHSTMHLVTFEAAKFDSLKSRLEDVEGLETLFCLKLLKSASIIRKIFSDDKIFQNNESKDAIILSEWISNFERSLSYTSQNLHVEKQAYSQIAQFYFMNEDTPKLWLNKLLYLNYFLATCQKNNRKLYNSVEMIKQSLISCDISKLNNANIKKLEGLEEVYSKLRTSFLPKTGEVTSKIDLQLQGASQKIVQSEKDNETMTFMMAYDWALIETLPSSALTCLRLNSHFLTLAEIGSEGLNKLTTFTMFLSLQARHGKMGPMSATGTTGTQKEIFILHTLAEFCSELFNLRELILSKFSLNILSQLQKLSLQQWEKIFIKLNEIISKKLYNPDQIVKIFTNLKSQHPNCILFDAFLVIHQQLIQSVTKCEELSGRIAFNQPKNIMYLDLFNEAHSMIASSQDVNVGAGGLWQMSFLSTTINGSSWMNEIYYNAVSILIHSLEEKVLLLENLFGNENDSKSWPEYDKLSCQPVYEFFGLLNERLALNAQCSLAITRIFCSLALNCRVSVDSPSINLYNVSDVIDFSANNLSTMYGFNNSVGFLHLQLIKSFDEMILSSHEDQAKALNYQHQQFYRQHFDWLGNIIEAFSCLQSNRIPKCLDDLRYLDRELFDAAILVESLRTGKLEDTQYFPSFISAVVVCIEDIKYDNKKLDLVSLAQIFNDVAHTLTQDLFSTLSLLEKISANRFWTWFYKSIREWVHDSHDFVRFARQSNQPDAKDILKRKSSLIHFMLYILSQLQAHLKSRNKKLESAEFTEIFNLNNTFSNLKVCSEVNCLDLSSNEIDKVCQRIQCKLSGLDSEFIGADRQMNVQDQARLCIERALDVGNLSRMYEGWTSWI